VFNRLTGFRYRELIPHKFMPPDKLGIFDMPGVHKGMEIDWSKLALFPATHAR
jgi:hypothetical protein